ncbi:MAG: hypothetical protein COB61_005850 [Thiotrichales bacterium]|nr:hypothetical protein [Thiotrichales bacterium]
MSKVRLISILLIIILVILSIYIYLTSQSNNIPIDNELSKSAATDSPKPLIENVEGYVAEANEWLAENKKVDTAKDDKSSIIDQLTKNHISNLFELSESRIKDIQFFGKVIDQHSNPVTNLRVRYGGTHSVFAAGSGEGYTATNEQGLFQINNVKGKSLIIEGFSQLGYQFPETEYFDYRSDEKNNKKSWRNSSIDSPYIFNAWKVESYPKIKKGKPIFGFIPDNRDYTINFLSAGSIKNEGVTEGNLRIRFKRDEKNWQLEIIAMNGGLQEAEDEYLNLAPEEGYSNSLSYRGKKHEARTIRKNIYFISRSGRLYGNVKMRIRPFHNKTDSAIRFTYVVNLEEGRNLSVKQ